ncbi:hypothetical protein [Streptomyces sp. NPDC096132]|uniref:hypothetical protein n=1 Tax=Streptomyces sp. NPDC096132 TaxID=3366075 RepID=UPI0038090916
MLGGGAAALYGVRHPVAAGAMAVVTAAKIAGAETFRTSLSTGGESTGQTG